MGELLRRYWHPVAAVAELQDHPIKALRLFGEDLVLFRDRSGNQGLVQRRCPHRGFDLRYGIVEREGIRCSYHGWRFDCQGQCRERPYEDVAHPRSQAGPRLALRSYPVEACSGLLWAYLGPQPAPLRPLWEPFTWPNGFRHVFFSVIPCNWLQCQENSIDPVHFEWLHLNWLRELHAPQAPPAPRHLKLCFEEFEFGFRYGRIVEGQSEDDEAWTVGRVCLWPNALYTGLNFSWRVPIDDHSTLAVDWAFAPVPQDRVPYLQERIPYSWVSLQDPSGSWVVTDVVHQDLTALVAQGTVADRTQENLGASDEGIILLRKKLFQEMDRVASQQDPWGILRKPQPQQGIPLPFMGRQYLLQHPQPQPPAAPPPAFDRTQRAAIQNHVISGLSEETVRMWSELFGTPPT